MSFFAPKSFKLDRYTTMGELAVAFRETLRSGNKFVSLVLGLETIYLVLQGATGVGAFMLIASGVLLALFAWRGAGIGVPVMPMLAVQHLLTYAMPIVIQHEDVFRYPPEFLFSAGLNVFVFLGAMTAAWKLGMVFIHPSPPIAYVLIGIDREGITGLSRIGFSLVVGATGFLVLQALDLTGFIFAILPSGTSTIVFAVTATTSACGFFLVSMIIGTGEIAAWQKVMFWLLLVLNCFISASSFLLSSAAINLSSVLIGFFWSTGRIPSRFTTIVILILAFLNLGKFTMRERYWNRGEDEERVTRSFSLVEMPGYYAEWSIASYESLFGTADEHPIGVTPSSVTEKKSQSLAERFNNLQNLLYVISVMEEQHVPALGGKTYTLIPPLLIPRIFWPDKPRTHAGQVMLNTYFGRQDLLGTFETYIAWGLVPEAYGNFGSIAGAMILGLVMGCFCSWLENLTARKPVLSAEGFVAFTLFMGMANSFEMVASVMVTSIFQSVILIIASCAPFVRRKTVGERPDETDEAISFM